MLPQQQPRLDTDLTSACVLTQRLDTDLTSACVLNPRLDTDLTSACVLNPRLVVGVVVAVVFVAAVVVPRGSLWQPPQPRDLPSTLSSKQRHHLVVVASILR